MLRKIDAMYAAYGKGVGICANCPHFIERIWDKKYFKCAAYGDSHSEATDWRKKWTACGLIDKPFPEKENRIVERMNYRREEQPIDGQISMLEEPPKEVT